MVTSAAVTSSTLTTSLLLAIAVGGVEVPPDNCFCDGNAHEMHGAACAGHPNLDCGLGKSPPIGCSTDFVACLTTIAKLKYVTNLTLTNGYANGLDLGDAEYTLIGHMLGSEPLANRLVSVALLDEREEGCTQSDAGLAGFGLGLQNMKKLRSLTLDNRMSKGLGSLTCSNNTSRHNSPAALSGFGAFGQSIGRGLGDTLRVIDLNFDGRTGAYAICDSDIVAFARLGIEKLSHLESVSLGLSYHEVGDKGAEALGASLANKRKLKGVNLRLKGFQVPSAGTKRGVLMTAVGLTKLADGLGKASTLISLALVLGDGANDLGVSGVNGLADGLSRLRKLQALWLRFEDDDNHPPPDASALITALGNLTELRAMHSDIRCLYCDEAAPPGCGGAHRGTIAPSLHYGAKCIECNGYPVPNQCNCWEKYEFGCSPCDRGNFALNRSSCTDFDGSLWR